jgi:hypothetical protein
MTLARRPLGPLIRAQFTNPVHSSCDYECTAIDHHTRAAVGSVRSAGAHFSLQEDRMPLEFPN